MQYTKGIYIVCNIQSRCILYAVYKAFDKILQNPTKSDTSMSKIVDNKKNRSLNEKSLSYTHLIEA